jgi:hypothetical protein
VLIWCRPGTTSKYCYHDVTCDVTCDVTVLVGFGVGGVWVRDRGGVGEGQEGVDATTISGTMVVGLGPPVSTYVDVDVGGCGRQDCIAITRAGPSTPPVRPHQDWVITQVAS